MLFNKSILAFAVMALTNVVAAGTSTAQTPACVLKIIGGTDNPGDSKAICGADASNIQSQILKDCGESEVKFFVNNCAQLGHKVESASSTGEHTATGTSTGTSGAATASGFVTAASSGGSATQTGSSAQATGTSGSGSSSSSSSGSSTGSAGGSSPSPTFNAAASDRKFDATTFAAAVFIGAAALL